MPWRERLRPVWKRAARWLRPVAATLAALLIAAGTAWLAVRLVMLAIGSAAGAAEEWQDTSQARQPPPPAQPPNTEETETPLEAHARHIGQWVLGLSAGGLLVLVVAALVAQSLFQDRRPADYFQPVGARPMPAANLLQGYHWVDQSAGVVQIPIDQAMELLAQRGLPARSAAESQAFSDQGQGGPSDSSGGRTP
jgi:hypothetical protein